MSAAEEQTEKRATRMTAGRSTDDTPTRAWEYAHENSSFSGAEAEENSFDCEPESYDALDVTFSNTDQNFTSNNNRIMRSSCPVDNISCEKRNRLYSARAFIGQLLAAMFSQAGYGLYIGLLRQLTLSRNLGAMTLLSLVYAPNILVVGT